MSFSLDASPDGALHGTGSDNAGAFNIAGSFDGNGAVAFVKSYNTQQWNYRGQLDVGSQNILGTWGSGGITYGSFDVHNPTVHTPSPGPSSTMEAMQAMLAGQWSGNFTYYNQPGRREPMSFFLTFVASNGALHGAGSDTVGDFGIGGSFNGNGTVTWVKSYSTDLRCDKYDKYRGQLDVSSGTILGTWGSGGSTYGSFDVVKS